MSTSATRQISDWLEKLGLSEYTQRFAENGINFAALPHLTDQDLKDIDVLLGHRRVMLAAISKLAGAAPATPEPTARAEPKPQDTAERRQVTVMFSDMVGSTALAAHGPGSSVFIKKCVAPIRASHGDVQVKGGRIRVTSADLQYLFGIRGLSPIA